MRTLLHGLAIDLSALKLNPPRVSNLRGLLQLMQICSDRSKTLKLS
jgi:hypothetical protein